MSEYCATVHWQRNKEEDFLSNNYSRAHAWTFDGGVTIPASPSPQVVSAPWSDAANVDPEEAFIASLSSCHMLFFLAFAARQGVVVDSYRDEAVGVLERNAAGKMAMTTVRLRPRIEFDPASSPTAELLDDLHHRAHEHCYIANSVHTTITIESQ